MNLKEAQERFEDLFENVVRGGNSAIAPNGQPYVSIVGGGTKKEGERFPALFSTEEIGAEWWYRAAVESSMGKRTTLYWREEPIMDSMVLADRLIPENCYWVVYSRFVTE